MDWDTVDLTASVATQTNQLAADSDVRVTWPHVISMLAPFLSFRDDAARPNIRVIEYTQLAMVVWPMLHQQDSVHANDFHFTERVLLPTEMHKIIMSLKASDFDFKSYNTYSLLVNALEDFAAVSLLPSLALAPTMLMEMATGTAAVLPVAPYSYAHNMEICDFATPKSKSYSKLGLLEMLSAPRFDPKDRYGKKGIFIRMVKTLNALLFQNNTSLSARLLQGELREEMEDEQGEAFVSFFVNSTFPNSAISVNKGVSFAARDPVRSELFDAMCSWRFSPSEHGEITTKYIMLILESLPILQACVLPAPTIEAARQNCLLLQQFATGSTSTLDYNGLVLLDIEAKRQNLSAPVSLDTWKTKLGGEKVAHIMSKAQGKSGPSASSISGPSTSTIGGSSKDHSLSVDTQSWLLTTTAQAVEDKLTKALASNSNTTAIMAVSRSKVGLFLQLFTRRQSLGSAEIWKRVPRLKMHLRDAMSFALTAKPDANNVLVQHTDLATYKMDLALYNQFWGDKRGEWHNILPHNLVHSIKAMKRSATNVTMYEAKESRRWGYATQNNAARGFLDNAFHFCGYDNGVFSAFIKPFNDILEENSDLTSKKKHTLQERVTNAISLGLREAGAAFADQFTSNSHLDPFPQNGTSLLPKHSMASRELSNINDNLEKLENKSFWGEDQELNELQEQVRLLKQQGPPPPLRLCPLHSA
jgi:hypothetical protein